MHGRFALWLALTALAALAGAGYSIVAGGSATIGASVGLGIGGSLMALELFVIQGAPGERLRQLPLPLYILASALLWSVIIFVCVAAIPELVELGEPDDVPDDDPTSEVQDLVFSFAIALILNAGIRVSALIGPRVLLNVLLGRYHRPLREQRVFMFLDLADSTRLAEQLGDLEVQRLIRRFFFDIATPIERHGGETHRYIGDEIVVTWPLVDCDDAAPWVRCVIDIDALIDERSAWYREHFGVVPRYRVGLHGGSVVASEVGQSKREIVYFGDTVNTAARLCAACKSVGAECLISAELLERAPLPECVDATRVPTLAIEGKGQPLDVFALRARDG